MTAATRAFVAALLTVAAASAFATVERAENFVLLDQAGKAHELYYESDAPAVAILSHSDHCPAMADAVAAFGKLEATAPAARYYLVNADADSSRPTLAADATTTNAPILDDDAELVSRGLSLDHAGELVVLDTRDWAVAYRGPAADAGAERALVALAAGERPEPVSLPVTGCAIDFTTPDGHAIGYSETIAPMLKENCAYCHAEGGIGPWAMTSYDMVRGFSLMIREVVRTKRMPPWHADPHIGTWQGDRSLTTDEIQTLVAWIDAGAPRGAGPDPLEQVKPLEDAWPLGEPDLVVDIPGFEVPASGVVDYQFPYVKNTLDHGVWVTAATVLPGDRGVVHHVLAGSIEGDTPPGDEDSVMENYIIGYAPGAESYVMPEGTGVYIAPGGYFTFQMHYTPNGKAVVDESRMGLYLSDAAPKNFLRHVVVVSPMISIPPNAADHEEFAYHEFHDDVIIHTLFPHSHYRGKSSTFEVQYPDGRTELVLSVPNYDFNWQRGYDPVEPLRLPAGSRLIHRTVYDNSAQNPANPDPAREVPWGLQSWDEMLYGAVSYSWANETAEHPIHDKRRMQTTMFVGFLDKNIDGKVSWRELPEDMKKRLVQGFAAVDTNGDGGLDIDEFLAMESRREAAGAEPAGD